MDSDLFSAVMEITNGKGLIYGRDCVKYDNHILGGFMEKSIQATEAVRRFSEILNTIKFKGEHYIIQRGGKPVAFMGTVEEAKKEHTLGELKSLLEQLPRLGKESESFERDMEEIRSHQPTLPAGETWE